MVCMDTGERCCSQYHAHQIYTLKPSLCEDSRRRAPCENFPHSPLAPLHPACERGGLPKRTPIMSTPSRENEGLGAAERASRTLTLARARPTAHRSRMVAASGLTTYQGVRLGGARDGDLAALLVLLGGLEVHLVGALVVLGRLDDLRVVPRTAARLDEHAAGGHAVRAREVH